MARVVRSQVLVSGVVVIKESHLSIHTWPEHEYAAADVLYLHQIRDKLETILQREGRSDLAKACFDFLSTRAELDLGGWPDEDIFAH